MARRFAAVCAIVTLGACKQEDESGPAVPVTLERTCSGGSAISTADIVGVSLPMKSVALTFDDGPGVRTAELSSYLKAEGVRASFFVNGKMIEPGNTQVLAQLIADGHFIGNHTQTHASLTGRTTGEDHLDDATIVAELAQTDEIIAPFVPNNRFVFRAPFGDYDEAAAIAINASPMKKYVGPVNWDIGDHMSPTSASDIDCWQPQTDGLVNTVAECAELYLKEFDSVGRGVALLHDPYFIDDNPALGGTVDMIKIIVPALKAKGYTFVRIDEVPEIAAQLPAAPDAPPADATAPPIEEPPQPTTSTNGPGKPDPCAPPH